MRAKTPSQFKKNARPFMFERAPRPPHDSDEANVRKQKLIDAFARKYGVLKVTTTDTGRVRTRRVRV